MRASVHQGDFGPFQPLIPAEVPLWLAVTLKTRQRCSIRPPAWLSAEELRGRLEQEKRGMRFEEFPPNFLEIAHLLLDAARDDIPDAHKVEGLIADIEAKRNAKLRHGLGQMSTIHMNIQMNHVTPLEVNRVRRFATGALDMLARLDTEPEGGAQTQPSQPGAPQHAAAGARQPGASSAALQLVLQRRGRAGAS